MILKRLFSNKIYFSDLAQCKEGSKNIVIQGYVKKVKHHSAVTFVKLTDGFTDHEIQVVLDKKLPKFRVGSAIEVNGDWVKSEGTHQEWELSGDRVKIMGSNEHEVIKGKADYLRQIPHLRPKAPSFASLLKLRSKVTFATHKFFEQEKFTHIDTPLLTLNDCEGAGETFMAVAENDDDFFGNEKCYLSVSGQFHLEACAGAIPKVYTLNSTFRAEKSLTRQHLAEFKMLEAEIGFCDDVEDLCQTVESYIKFVASTVINELDDIKRVREIYKEPDSLSTLLEMMDGKPFERITFSKAIEILKRKKDVPQSVGLSKANELSLVKYCNGPVFVTNFPAIQKPFYMETESGEMQKLETKSFDLLAPLVGELAGGSVRKSTVADLSNAPDSKNIQWYKDLRSHGYPVSGGFGIGMERLIQSLFGIPSIKDTLPFPRYYKHIQC